MFLTSSFWVAESRCGGMAVALVRQETHSDKDRFGRCASKGSSLRFVGGDVEARAVLSARSSAAAPFAPRQRSVRALPSRRSDYGRRVKGGVTGQVRWFPGDGVAGVGRVGENARIPGFLTRGGYQ